MDELLGEIEALEAILLDDVIIKRNAETGVPELIETTVFPTVGDNFEQQYVCLTLMVIPGPGYPDEMPTFKLRNPRGLSDACIATIEKAVVAKLIESLGQPVVFDLIEVIREHLTESNLPTGQCVICLYGFCEGDQFTKTACYHYLHSHCLINFDQASKRNYQEEVQKLPAWQQQEAKPYKPTCPVCRESLENIEIDPLFASKPPKDLENAPHFVLTNELKSLQREMSRLYLRQKQRGGIIDLDAEETVLALGLDNEQDDSRGAAAYNANQATDSARNAQQPTTATTNRNQLNQTRLRNQQLAASKNRAAIEKDKDNSEEDNDKSDGGRNRHSKNHRGRNFHHHRHRYGNANGGSKSTDPDTTTSTNIPNTSGGKNRDNKIMNTDISSAYHTLSFGSYKAERKIIIIHRM